MNLFLIMISFLKISMFAAYTFLAYAVAFPFSLMFEAPFMLIDKKYLTGKLSNSVK